MGTSAPWPNGHTNWSTCWARVDQPPRQVTSTSPPITHHIKGWAPKMAPTTTGSLTGNLLIGASEYRGGAGEVHGINPRSGAELEPCLLYTSPSPRDGLLSRMPSS